MNFLIINHYAGAPALGMELRPYYFGRELVKKGHKVSIVASAFSHYRRTQPEVVKNFSKEVIDDIEYFWIRTPAYRRNNLKRFYNILVFLLRLLYYRKRISHNNHFYAVIASSTYPMDIFPSRWFAKKCGSKLIYEVHDLWPLSPMVLGGMSKWNPFIILMQISENYAYRHCDNIISLLENAKDHMVEHGLEPSKFNYLPNGINPDEWIQNTFTQRSKQSNEIQKFKKKYNRLIGYAGAIGPANAMKPFIETANILKSESYGFVILGNGQEKEYLMNLAESLNLNNILFLDPVKKKDLHPILSLFDILYIGYKNSELYNYGVSPNKIFDYIMAEKPIIFGLGYQYSLIENTDSVYQTEPDNPEKVAELIRKIDKSDTKSMKKNALKSKDYIINNHSFNVLTDKLIDIIIYE